MIDFFLIHENSLGFMSGTFFKIKNGKVTCNNFQVIIMAL